MQTIVELPAAASPDTAPVPVPIVAPTTILEVPAKPEDTMPITIGRPKLAILDTLLDFRKMTAEMLNDYLYSEGTFFDTQRHLRELLQEGYIKRSLPMKQSRFGSAPYAYGLDTKGFTYLKKLGRDVPNRYRDEQQEGYPISHTLAVNQVLMKAKYLDENNPTILLRDFEHETTLNAKPLRVQVPDQEKPISISPDLWLYFYTTDRFHYCPTIEVNLSRMWQKDWRLKVRAYLHCLPVYEERFGIDVLTVAVIVTTSRRTSTKPRSELSTVERREQEADVRDREKRLLNFLLWTEAELKALHAEQEALLFRFTNVALDSITAEELFFGNHWHIPFDDALHPLILPVKEQHS